MNNSKSIRMLTNSITTASVGIMDASINIDRDCPYPINEDYLDIIENNLKRAMASLEMLKHYSTKPEKLQWPNTMRVSAPTTGLSGAGGGGGGRCAPIAVTRMTMQQVGPLNATVPAHVAKAPETLGELAPPPGFRRIAPEWVAEYMAPDEEPEYGLTDWAMNAYK